MNALEWTIKMTSHEWKYIKVLGIYENNFFENELKVDDKESLITLTSTLTYYLEKKTDRSDEENDSLDKAKEFLKILLNGNAAVSLTYKKESDLGNHLKKSIENRVYRHMNDYPSRNKFNKKILTIIDNVILSFYPYISEFETDLVFNELLNVKLESINELHNIIKKILGKNFQIRKECSKDFFSELKVTKK